MKNLKPIIGITMGDPAGIGPEIILKALKYDSVYKWCLPVVIGKYEIFKKLNSMIKVNKKLQLINDLQNLKHDPSTIYILDIQTDIDVQKIEMGKISPIAGELSYKSIIKSIELALSNKIHAVTTAPVSKEAINLAGYKFQGHTEIFAELTNSKKYAMLLIYKNLKVAHVSTHVPLKVACDLVKKDRVIDVIELLHQACINFGIKKPKLAVAGLNPHAGENGLLGEEEIKEIIPAIQITREKNITVDGPFPPDTVFSLAINGMYDGIVAMYHDQGHIPLKTIAFKWDKKKGKMKSVKGVNITIGLPIIRTSVDHGTAFDIAGKNLASEEAMLNAIKYASIMAKNKIKYNI